MRQAISICNVLCQHNYFYKSHCLFLSPIRRKHEITLLEKCFRDIDSHEWQRPQTCFARREKVRSNPIHNEKFPLPGSDHPCCVTTLSNIINESMNKYITRLLLLIMFGYSICLYSCSLVSIKVKSSGFQPVSFSTTVFGIE